MQKWRVCVQIGKVAGHLAQDFACTVLRYGGLPFAARMNLQIHPDFKQRIQSEFGLHHHQIGRIDQLAQQLLVDQSQPFVVFGIEGQQIVQQPVKCILFNINCAILKRRFIVGNRRLYLIEMQKQIISHGHMISFSFFPCEICAFCTSALIVEFITSQHFSKSPSSWKIVAAAKTETTVLGSSITSSRYKEPNTMFKAVVLFKRTINWTRLWEQRANDYYLIDRDNLKIIF